MTKKSYIVESPFPVYVEIPRVVLEKGNSPQTFSLTEKEVEILREVIPNVKIVPVNDVSSEEETTPVFDPSTVVDGIKSMSLNKGDAIKYISGKSSTELLGFLSENEDRVTVINAYNTKVGILP